MQRHTWTLHSVGGPVLRLVILMLMFAAVSLGVAAPQQDTPGPPSKNPCGPMTGACEDAPKIIAVKFHADWCGFCKQMGAAFEELQAKFDQEPALYVTFDQTRDFGRKQSQYLAHAMGLDDVWKENGGKTGFILLIDPKTKQVVQRLTHEQNLKQIGAALQEAVQKAPKAEAPAKPARPNPPEHPEHPKKK
ncbi:MAG: protein disulfide isomerase family protein [Phycisphaerales bacterium]|nr:protein disulfide isomerase family protein [Phycisphaerales bacterium]MCI0632040.1 protein disulfide isomerase family protein [Phycisphaerales bacterium]